MIVDVLNRMLRTQLIEQWEFVISEDPIHFCIPLAFEINFGFCSPTIFLFRMFTQVIISENKFNDYISLLSYLIFIYFSPLKAPSIL